MFKYSHLSNTSLSKNHKHCFAIKHSMMLYKKNAIYTFIPKNACSTMRLSVAIENGCIEGVENINWIHSNNGTFNASLSEAIKVDYSFVVLRCPFRRLASAFSDRFASKKPDGWNYYNLLDRKINLDDLTFKEFVFSLQQTSVLKSNIHWRPQVDFLLYKSYSDYFSVEEFLSASEVLYDKLGFSVIDARKYTQHGNEMYHLLGEQYYGGISVHDLTIMKKKGESVSYKSLYDDETIAVVKNIYKQDIEEYVLRFGNENLLF